MNCRKMCPTCGITLRKQTSLSTHMRNLHTGPIHQWLKSSHTTRNIYSLKLHFHFRHTESLKKSCEFCGKVVKDLNNHLRATMCGKDVDNRNMLQCPKCYRKMMGNSRLLKHIKNIHERIKDIQCLKCSYTTYSRLNLRLHISTVQDKTTIFRICPHCQMKTGSLEAHIATYHSEQIPIVLK